MATWQIVVRGQVQGVGYRAACVAAAREIGVVGWVRNCRDGSVEVLAQGEPGQLLAMCDWMRHGPPGARVSECSVDEAMFTKTIFTRFEQRMPDVF
ncbi:acylphosphatase [Pandoraea terrae]|uniref:acylphosphatase n=1 Tax=Pandoraea terrae TaxID=1537710 RepID=A0A5E4SBJ7_9BURK|nr:acylphosphatase [Pandoraea terrae]VVD73236.1 acylphosphatase [Pandoraea terrae]